MSKSNQKQAPGETSLTKLLATLQPILHSETYIFLTIPPSHPSFGDLATLHASLQPKMLFHEREGLTVITTPALASAAGFEKDKDYVFECKMITLTVHSSLEAVGLTAVFSKALTEKNVSANVVSGFYHDHIFVPVGKEDVAVRVLEEVQQEALARTKAEVEAEA
ncbi:ACT domain-containing protein [Aspergillus mulundensis]|uniref:DUF2241 domain-containing protein n=1 Tax=Aspergillus mulundensis TaxID=1810919 RepID=A0A3D8SXK4_9EURO|nr:Uncharacterized protein DSM5745_02273 [Aspergillus mulundensis]RDW90498.1 Uncharacterized protein DSM5745_02273 [Aspergillus mulundensis]